jgi:glycerate dehydrogenase
MKRLDKYSFQPGGMNMKKKFKKIAILDKIILSEVQWVLLRTLAEEVTEYSGLTPKQVAEKLSREQGTDPGAVCFTALALEEVTAAELNRRLDGADAVITCWTNIPDMVLQANPQIRYIGFWTNLVSHRIKMELAEKMGIHVTYIPDYGTTAVAEYVFALLQEMYRRVAKQAKDTASGKWPYELLKTALYVPSIDAIPYRTLEGKTLGIIGFGRIGQRVAQIATGYGMQVAYYSLHRKFDLEGESVNYSPLDDVLSQSDIVTVHLSPYANADLLGRISLDDHAPDCPENSPESNNDPILSRGKISLIKDGAIFINTSAGRLVDEEALLDEAESGRLRIALDVYRSNPNKKRIQRIIQKHGEGRNIFTFRGGWFTYESVLFKGDSLIQQIQTFLEDQHV